MKLYRKKPIIVKAEQFFPEMATWPVGVYQQNTLYWLDTLEGKFTVHSRDWIITGVKGEHYPCKPDIFEMTYEEVDDPA